MAHPVPISSTRREPNPQITVWDALDAAVPDTVDAFDVGLHAGWPSRLGTGSHSSVSSRASSPWSRMGRRTSSGTETSRPSLGSMQGGARRQQSRKTSQRRSTRTTTPRLGGLPVLLGLTTTAKSPGLQFIIHPPAICRAPNDRASQVTRNVHGATAHAAFRESSKTCGPFRPSATASAKALRHRNWRFSTMCVLSPLNRTLCRYWMRLAAQCKHPSANRRECSGDVRASVQASHVIHHQTNGELLLVQ